MFHDFRYTTNNSNLKTPSLLLATKDNNLRTKDVNKKSSIHKDRERKLVSSNKASKAILKPNTGRKTFNNLSSIVTEVKKCGDLSQNQSPILMTTIDSDGIKSVTSAAGA